MGGWQTVADHTYPSKHRLPFLGYDLDCFQFLKFPKHLKTGFEKIWCESKIVSDFLKKDIESLDFNSIVNKTNFFFKYKNCVISFKFLLFDLSQRIHYNLTLLTYLLLHLSRFYLLLFDENKNNYIEYKKKKWIIKIIIEIPCERVLLKNENLLKILQKFC